MYSTKLCYKCCYILYIYIYIYAFVGTNNQYQSITKDGMNIKMTECVLLRSDT